jgi:Choline dehydrogenase and related flavoproteins
MAVTPEYDVIVIGSGAAGGWVAKETAEGGFRTLMLEAGRMLDPKTDFPDPGENTPKVYLVNRVKAMVLGQHVQARCMSFKPATAHLFINDRLNPYTVGRGTRFNWYRSRQVGGRLHLWGRNAIRISEQDLKAAEIDGFGDSWPISYGDLAPWYSRVERFLGVTGQPAGIVNLPDGEFSGPNYLTSAERRLLEKLAEKWPDRPATTSRVIHHMPDRQLPTLKAAKASGHFELRSGAVVVRIETDRHSGLATGVTYVDDATRERVTVTAKVVALAASTIESVRILLNSKGERHPRGLGNSSGNLGRYLVDHLLVVRAGRLPEIEGLGRETDPYDFGAHTGIFIPSFRNRGTNDGLGFLRGYSLMGCVGRIEPGWYFMTIGEVLPRAENRVELDPAKRDGWGIPVAKVTMRYSDNERAMLRDMNETLDDLCRTFALPADILGKENLLSRIVFKIAGRLLYTREGALIPGSSVHESGGACMGTDRSRHVLNADNQVFDAPNVYVTDSAAFPTNPFQNPALTIMALSARAGHRIATELKTAKD